MLSTHSLLHTSYRQRIGIRSHLLRRPAKRRSVIHVQTPRALSRLDRQRYDLKTTDRATRSIVSGRTVGYDALYKPGLTFLEALHNRSASERRCASGDELISLGVLTFTVVQLSARFSACTIRLSECRYNGPDAASRRASNASPSMHTRSAYRRSERMVMRRVYVRLDVHAVIRDPRLYGLWRFSRNDLYRRQRSCRVCDSSSSTKPRKLQP